MKPDDPLSIAIEGFTTIKYTIPFKRFGEPITIVPFGDIHRNSRNCCVPKWLEFLKWARNKKNCYFLGMGDYEDFLSYSERRVLTIAKTELHDDTISEFDDIAEKLVSNMAKELSFMKGRIIGLIEGNHYALMKNGMSTTQRLCQLLDCSYLGANSFINLSFAYESNLRSTLLVSLFAHHGLGSARSGGGSINRVEDMAKVADADIYLMGHDHKRGVVSGQILRLGEGNPPHLYDSDRLFGRTGSFLRAYTPTKGSYVTSKLLPPANLGTLRIECTPQRRRYSLPSKKRMEERYMDLHASV